MNSGSPSYDCRPLRLDYAMNSSELMPLNALLIEDNPGDARFVQEMLRDMHFARVNVQWAQTLKHGVELFNATTDVVFLDLHLPDAQGLNTVRRFRREAGRGAAIIVLTGLDDEELAVQAVRAGAQDYLPKGSMTADLLRRALRYALDRNHSEQQLREISAELVRYSSHLAGHLRSPLRRILGFTSALIDAPELSLTERVAFLTRIVDCGTSMRGMIDHLDELNRVLGNELCHSSVDLSLLVAIIGKGLNEQFPNHNVKLVITEQLHTLADPYLARIALEQLLSNAWKFTRNVAEPVVEFGRSIDDPHFFYVRDNGAGFDPSQVRRLFLPFERLHNANDFEGSGIGLAIVKRVIDRHGGRCFATSNQGLGATFYFSFGENPHGKRLANVA